MHADAAVEHTEFDIVAHGGKPIMAKTGHSVMKARMKEEKAPLAGELSGHIFFQDDFYGIKMLNILPEDKVMWASDYPHPASTWPDSQRVFSEEWQGVAADVLQKITRSNARSLFGIE